MDNPTIERSEIVGLRNAICKTASKRVNLFYPLILLSFILSPILANAQADTIRYVTMGGSYKNHGRNWDKPMDNVQDAINDLYDYLQKNGNDQIVTGSVYVGAGVYTPTESTESSQDGILYTSFKIPEGISLYGGFTADGKKKDGVNYQQTPNDRYLKNGLTITENSASAVVLGDNHARAWEFADNSITILSGDHNSTADRFDFLTWSTTRQQYTEQFPGSSYHVVWFATNGFFDSDDLATQNRAKPLTRTSVVDGCLITGGYASNTTVASRDHRSFGGGVYMVDGAVLRNCLVQNNAAARRGGGVYCDGGGRIEGCMIQRNQSKGIGLTDGYGGGVCIDHYGYLGHSVVNDNCARIGGGVALWQDRAEYPDCLEGGANYRNAFETILTTTLIENNTATTEGGGLLMRGGTADHITLVRNHCAGNVVSISGRKYGRSGGLFIEVGAAMFNSVIWGNTTYANGDVQYSCYIPNSSDTNLIGDRVSPYLCFTAVAALDYADWGGTTREGVFGLETNNRRPSSGRNTVNYYPEFSGTSTLNDTWPLVNGVAGVELHASDAARCTVLHNHFVPDNFSDLISKGIKLSDYLTAESKVMIKAAVETDLNGHYFSPLTIIGAYIAKDLNIAPTSRVHTTATVPAMDGVSTGLETLFVDPQFNRAKTNKESGTYFDDDGKEIESRGDCWDNPLIYLCDALEYAKANPTQRFQILVKEGTSIIGNRQVNKDVDEGTSDEVTRLRDLTASIPSNVQIYGSFYGGLEGTNLELNGAVARSPIDYPSVLSANVTRQDYDDNIAHVITIDGVSNVIIDGFKINSGNTTSNQNLAGGAWTPKTSNGAGLLIQNSSNITLRNILIAHCYASNGNGAAIYAENTTGLDISNLIVHNNTSTVSSPSVILFNNTTAKIDHALIRGNMGGIGLIKNSKLALTNSAFHGNNDGSGNKYLEVISQAYDNIALMVEDGSTVNGSNNMFGLGAQSTTLDALRTNILTGTALDYLGYDSEGSYISASEYPCLYPIFTNPINTIGVRLVSGVPTDGDITVFGGAANYTPRTMSPMVNMASDDMADQSKVGYDFSLNIQRSRGGAADIGALENDDLPAYGKVLYVRITDGNDANDGYSWGKALKSLSEALKKAENLQAVEEIWVAKGTYTAQPTGDKLIEQFYAYKMVEDVDVYGGFPSQGNPGQNERNPKSFETIIQAGDENPSVKSATDASSYGRVLVQPKKFDTETVWNGFTIQHGYLFSCYRQNIVGNLNDVNTENIGETGGAGVYLTTNGVIENCVIKNNMVYVNPDPSSSMTQTGSNDGGYHQAGAGVYNSGGTLRNCVIENNKLLHKIYKNSSKQHESAWMYGAGLFQDDGTVYNTIICGNECEIEKSETETTHNFHQAVAGAGAFLVKGKFYNNTISGNKATILKSTESGKTTILASGLYVFTDITMYNCIVANNLEETNDTDQEKISVQKTPVCATNYSWSADLSKWVYSLAPSKVNAHFCNVYIPDDTYVNLVARNTANKNNIFTDPKLTPTYELEDQSPCINSGTQSISGVTIPDIDAAYTDRVKDCAIDIGAYEFDGTLSITPSVNDSENQAIYYVSNTGYGLRTGSDPANAACWQKLQKVLDAAGRYKAEHVSTEVVVRLAESTDDDFIGYAPTRVMEYTDEGHKKLTSTNPREYTIMIPKGILVEGGWNDAKDNATQFTDRDILNYQTRLTGKYIVNGQEVNAYHVVNFTSLLFNEEGKPQTTTTTVDDVTKTEASRMPDTAGRAVLDGVFISDGYADGNDDSNYDSSTATTRAKINAYWPNNYGGAAIVPSYAHIRNCVIEDNYALSGGGGLFLKPQALVSGCIIRNNSSDNDGGGVYVCEPTASVIQDIKNADTWPAESTKDPDERDADQPSIYGPTAPYTNIFTSTIVGNNAAADGGGIYFQNNLRMNSTVLWKNTSNNYSNLAGVYNPTNAERPWDYPLQYCAVENMRVPGYNNISVATAYHDGVRWATEEYANWTNPEDYSDYDQDVLLDASILGQDEFYYGLRKYSMLARAGMSISDYQTICGASWFSTLGETDIKGISRLTNSATLYATANGLSENGYVEIGARVFNGTAKETIDFDNLMTRLYVVMPEDTDDLSPYVMSNSSDPMYKQQGSSMAYPMQTLTDALEYIRDVRKAARKFTDGAYTNNEGVEFTTEGIAATRFEIFMSRGTYYPFRTITGSYTNTRGNTFLVPEGVAIYGGMNPEGEFTSSDKKWLGQSTSETTEVTYTDTDKIKTYSLTLVGKATPNILQDRPTYDNNQNNIIEGWELEQQTVLSGDVVNADNTKNVFHVITVMADEEYVGAISGKKTFTIGNDDYNNWVAGTPAETGKAVILDGLQITEGYATHYENSVMSTSTYYKGGAICVDGNWATCTTDADGNYTSVHHCLDYYNVNNTSFNVSAYDQAKRMVGWRDIPLIVRNCFIYNNQACMGGAIFTNGELMTFSSMFAQNRAKMHQEPSAVDVAVNGVDSDYKPIYYGRGGAIDASYRAFLVNTIFANNTARGPGSGNELDDDENLGYTTTIKIEGKDFHLPTGTGGAIVMGENGHLRMLNCDVVRNEAHGYPAIFLFKPNKGYDELTSAKLVDIVADNPHQIVNTIFWGNELIDDDLNIAGADIYKSALSSDNVHYEWVMNPGQSREITTTDSSTGETTTTILNPESLWFCAYEDGKWFNFVNPIDETHDFRTAKYFYDGSSSAAGTYHYVPWIMEKDFNNSSVTSPDAKAHIYNFNIKLNPSNSDPDGPNFINPSVEAGTGGYMPSADWMMGRINNLVDQGWTYMKQKVTTSVVNFLNSSGDTVESSTEDTAGDCGSGIYYELANLMYKKSDLLTDEVRSMPTLKDKYMLYAMTDEDDGGKMLRVSTDPNPCHKQSYIDIGAYEYQHVQLNSTSVNGVDILWVAESENSSQGTADGSSYLRPTSDLQRAIETLLASRNDHHKEIRLLGGTFMPVYTISKNMAFTINTGYQDANAITPLSTDNGYKDPENTSGFGVKSFTIRGGYNPERFCQYIDGESVIYMAERQGVTNQLLQHLFVIEDARQRYTSNASSATEYGATAGDNVIPIALENITFTNVMAYGHTDDDLDDYVGGSAIFYKPQIDENDHYLGAPVGYPKLEIKNCKFLYNGAKIGSSVNDISVTKAAPAVTIGEGGGQALIYNSLFAKNAGSALIAYGTTCVNNTFAHNGDKIDLQNYKLNDDQPINSGIYNSILWQNYKMQSDSQPTDWAEWELAEDVDNDYNTLTNYKEEKADDHNTVLGDDNRDVMNGPNFTDPDNDDFSVQPSVKITGTANWEAYVKKISLKDTDAAWIGLQSDGVNMDADAVSKYFNNTLELSGEENKVLLTSQNVTIYLNDSTYTKVRDLAGNVRLYDGSLERGAYESSSLMARVLYVNPRKTTPGVGTTWGNAFSRSQLQTAIDAAAVYTSSKGESSYVIVKGNDEWNMGDITLYNGVHMYGGIQSSYNDEAIEYDEKIANSWSDEDVALYIQSLTNDEDRAIVGPGNSMSHIRSVTVKNDGSNARGFWAMMDGFDFTPMETPSDNSDLAKVLESDRLTASPVVVDAQSDVADATSMVVLKNCVFHDYHMAPGVPVIDLKSGSLLYNSLVRHCSTPDATNTPKWDNDNVLVKLGSTSNVLNCTLVNWNNNGNNIGYNSDNDYSIGSEGYPSSSLVLNTINNYYGTVAQTEDYKTSPFAPYFQDRDDYYHSEVTFDRFTSNRNLWFQLHEGSLQLEQGSVYAQGNTLSRFQVKMDLNQNVVNGERQYDPNTGAPLYDVGANTIKYVDFYKDRDLLGNPRLVNFGSDNLADLSEADIKMDNGCFETWSTGTSLAGTVTQTHSAVLYPTRNKNYYGGNFFPHEGSVVYIQKGGAIVLPKHGDIDSDDNNMYFDEDEPFKPGYLLVREGGSLYGQGSTVRLPYVAVQRILNKQYSMISLPFDFTLSTCKMDGKEVYATAFGVDYQGDSTEGIIVNPYKVSGDEGFYYYDGEARSAYNYGFAESNSQCWKPWQTNTSEPDYGIEGTKLRANHGVLLDLAAPGNTSTDRIIRFTAFAKDLNTWLYEEGAERQKEVTLTQHDDRTSTSGAADYTHEYNMGWNLVGLPYLISDYDARNLSVPHLYYQLDSVGAYETAKQSWLDAKDSDGKEVFNNMMLSKAFFTQTATLNETETLKFVCPYYRAVSSGASAQAIIGLSSASNSNSRGADEPRQDCIAFNIGDKDSVLGYVWGRDGAKFNALLPMPQVYALADGLPLSLLGDAPIDVDIPLGIDLPEEGSYCFALEAWSDWIDDSLAPYLTDREAATTINLLEKPYIFTIGGAADAGPTVASAGVSMDGGLSEATVRSALATASRFALRLSAKAPSLELKAKEYVVFAKDERVVIRNLEAGDYITIYTTDGKLVLADIAHESQWQSRELSGNTIYIVCINHFAKKVKI